MEERSIVGAQEGAVRQGENLVGIATDTTGVGGGLVGVGAGCIAEFVRQDSAGSNSSISVPHPRKPLRKKSVSFTAEESYQVCCSSASYLLYQRFVSLCWYGSIVELICTTFC